MPMIVPSYPDPQDPTTPVVGACAWVAEVHFSHIARSSIRVLVNRSVAAANATPIPEPLDMFTVYSGETLVPADGETPAVTFPTRDQIIAEAHSAMTARPELDPEQAIGYVLQNHLMNHPKLVGATLV